MKELNPSKVRMRVQKKTLPRRIYLSRYYYLLLLPAIVYYIVFKYIPIYGIQLAFKKFNYGLGIAGSPWIFLDNFRFLFAQPAFWTALRNTLIISLMRLIFGFPVPVLLALLINELRMPRFKRGVQIICTFPHFLSWVVLSGIVLNLLGSTGGVNALIAALGGQKINFLVDGNQFRAMLIYSDVWKEAGWSTIIYIAAMTAVDASQYEAALIDGANRCTKSGTSSGRSCSGGRDDDDSERWKRAQRGIHADFQPVQFLGV
jgi:putative aldouronate transport system permease protein